ncbi:magnesium transporter CorA family protein [Abiotrophia defectiva]|uniref:magnesium transporter CorA family protein n=1 Tax=Abiotrophia defectiva TaxID=46125 RepID=UPI0028D376E1|nr:magnesium transporter CorA family protein [Abiotrophia defectiva]
MISMRPINETDSWLNIDVDTIASRPDLLSQYGLDEEIVEYALDRNERARTEYDRERNTFIIIYNVPNPIKQDYHYETVPMTFIVQPNRLITISNEANAYLIPEFSRYLDANFGVSVFTFLFASLYTVSEQYFPLVEKINQERDQLNQVLRQKTTKQNLFALSDLATGVVYFVSATKQNVVLLEQLRTQFMSRLLDETAREELEDSLIEAKQLVEMTQLTSTILHQLSGTYNNVLNNNLNDTMKLLTIVSILLTIPDIITSFFGMNMPLPFEQDAMGWVYILLISAVGWVIGLRILNYLMDKKQ